MRVGTGEDGQALVTVALAMVVLLGFAGLAIDVGVLRYEQRLLQTVADSAAIGGASDLGSGWWQNGATAAAAKNNFTDGVNAAILTVNNPPQSGPHLGDSAYVEVIAKQVAPTYFMQVFGINTALVGARAVAYGGGGPNCIYALSPTADNAIYLNGNNVNVQAKCGVIDDSNSSTALYGNGNNITLNTLNAGAIGVAGNYILNSGNGNFNPTPKTGMTPVPDPLAYLPPPSIGPCNFNNYTVGGTATLNPGVYCGGLTVNAGSNITFSPGLYVISGGNGLYVNGNSTLNGTGVTFYTTANAQFYLNADFITANLSAPTTGTYKGILLFQDRSNTQPVYFNGGSNSQLQGALYSADAQLYLNGNISMNTCGMIVALTIYFNGNNVNVSINNPCGGGGSPIKGVSLVE